MGEWRRITPFAPRALSVVLSPSEPQVLWACCGPDRSPAYSADRGETWNWLSPESAVVTLVAVDPANAEAAMGTDTVEPGRIVRVAAGRPPALLNPEPMQVPLSDRTVPAEIVRLFTHTVRPLRLYANLSGRPGDVPSTVPRQALARSDDGGVAWRVVAPDVQVLAVDPHDADVLYARTDLPGSNEGFVSARPLLKSVDGGVSWQPLDEQLTSLAFSVAVDRVDSNRVYVARFKREPKTWQLDGTMELNISRDAGATWELLTPLKRVRAFEPAQTWTLEANPARNGGLVATYGSTLVLHTSDAGESWADLSRLGEPHEAARTAIDAAGEYAYLTTASGELYRRRLLSDVSALRLASCTTRVPEPRLLPPGVAPNPAFWAANSPGRSPEPASRYLQSDDYTTIYRSDDGGASWLPLAFDASPYVLIRVDRWRSDRLFMLGRTSLSPNVGGSRTDSRLYVSEAAAEPVPLSEGPIGEPGYYGGEVSRLLQFDGRPELLIAEKGIPKPPRSSTAHLYRSLDGGRTWQLWLRDAVQPLADSASPLAFYVRHATGTTPTGNIYSLHHTRDDGANWQLLDPLPRDHTVSEFRISPDATHRLYLAKAFRGDRPSHLFTSADAGQTWRELPRPEADPAGREAAVRAMLPDPDDPAGLYAVTDLNPYPTRSDPTPRVRAWWSGDYGGSWQPVDGLPELASSHDAKFLIEADTFAVGEAKTGTVACRVVKP